MAHSAQILQDAAPELTEPPPDLAEHPWREDAATFQNTTRQLAAAITARDKEALSQLGDVLYQSCETCHQVYLKPAPPVTD
ncbi:hypothetical protein FACS189441_8650 [Betaproteobacteria bacterium]|nr:hypothetical protein FACS189441_8650 [Betaproteobacteria bacterium]